MLNPVDPQPKPKKEKIEPGVTIRSIGILVAILSVLAVIAQLIIGEPGATPWLGFALSFGLIVIGYLQTITARLAPKNA